MAGSIGQLIYLSSLQAGMTAWSRSAVVDILVLIICLSLSECVWTLEGADENTKFATVSRRICKANS